MLAKDTSVMRSSSPQLSLRTCRRLKSRKERRETGLYIAEGIRPVMAALQANAGIVVVLYAPDLLRGSEHGHAALDIARSRHIPCQRLTSQEFESLATRERPQGIACVGRQAWSSLDDLLVTESGGPLVALYEPQDPGNLGTILRCCDATGCAGVILIGNATDPWHPWALRAAMGATFASRLAQCDTTSFAQWVQANRLPVIGTSDRGSVDFATATYPSPFVLLMGSERQGLPADLEEVAETIVRIPMAGCVDSLNLAVATALVLYEARRQDRLPAAIES
jgi:TrmH family RNA methyltransferase